MERRAPAGDNVIPGGDDTDIMGGDAIDIRLIHTYTCICTYIHWYIFISSQRTLTRNNFTDNPDLLSTTWLTSAQEKELCCSAWQSSVMTIFHFEVYVFFTCT